MRKTILSNSLRHCRTSSLAWMAGLALAIGCPVGVWAGDAGESVISAAPPIQVIAHRGGALARPENTMPAFHHAAGMGAEYLEFDMMLTRDNRIVVHHDASVNPEFCAPTEGTEVAAGPVRERSFADMRAFDCGSAVRPSYAGAGFLPVPGAQVPDLEEVFATFGASDALFFPETKIPQGADIDPVLFATLFEDAVRRHGLEDRVILQSFDFRTIDALHTLNPRIRTCLLGVPRQTRDYLPVLLRHNATCIVLAHDEIDADGVRALQQEGVLVFSGVADKAEDWQKYIDLGFDALFTNDPESVIAFLRRSGLRQPELRAIAE